MTLENDCILITLRAKKRGETLELSHAVDRELLSRAYGTDTLVNEFRKVVESFLHTLNTEEIDHV
jgi:hypothetical protein